MIRESWIRFAGAAVVAGTLSGCSWLFPPSSAIERDRFPSISADATEEVLELISSDVEQLHTARILVKSTLKRSIGSETVRQAVVFEHPARLRLEIFAPGLNKLLALLITQGNALYMLDPNERRVFLGEASANIVEKLLSFPFTPAEFMRWSVGRYPGDLRAGSVAVGRDSAGRILILHQPEPGREFRAVLEGQGERFRLSHLEVMGRSDDDLLFKSEFHYQQADSVTPSQVDIELPKKEATGELVIERITVNPTLGSTADRLFKTTVPPDAEVVDLNRQQPVAE